MENCECWAVVVDGGYLLLEGVAPDLYPSFADAKRAAKVAREIYPEARAVAVSVSIEERSA
jgi:hypothetical protein